MNGDDGAVRVVLARKQHLGFELFENAGKVFISRSRSPLTFSPSRASSNSVSRSEVSAAIAVVLAICSSRRLRSCMIFWLFSGFDQKSGALICSSSLASWVFRVGASKIAPHSVSLLAERSVFSFQFVESHIQFNSSK